MKKLLVYIKEYRKECVFGPLFKLLEALFDLIVPLVTAAIIDYGIANRDKTYILQYGMGLVLLALVGLTCSITAQFFAAKAAVGFAANLRHALFEHIESLSFTEMDQIGTSTLITRMTSDINQVQSGVNMALRLFLRSPFIVFGAMISAFFIDVRAAIVFAVVIPLLAVVVFGIMAICMPLYKKVQGALDKVLGSTRENLTGVRVIRAFHREKEEEQEYCKENDVLAKEQLLVGKISALTNPLTYVMINMALVALLWTGAVQIDIGVLKQGQVIALINYLSQILVELIKLANTIVLSNKALACANRIANVLEVESSLEQKQKNFLAKELPEETGTQNAGIQDVGTQNAGTQNTTTQSTAASKQTVRGQVVFDNVSLCYQGAQEPSIEDVNFTANAGDTIGIIGGTGSGKSSLVHLIPRFYDATKGHVLVDGKDVRSVSLEELRGKIGIVMQKAVLFEGTIRENLLWGNENATEEDLEEALELSQAKEFVDKKQNGMDALIEQGGRNLSGGQRQRLTIARALVRKPEILILDDSTSALDYATDARLRKGIQSLSYHPTVFIVSQRTSSICHADNILVLEDGQVLAMGTHEELLKTCDVYAEIHYSQFQKETRQNQPGNGQMAESKEEVTDRKEGGAQ
ncbi:MAG: ABC transporter ATP-binding protein [Butyribacter sp.]|nr:ABC transporter ATP-binding protein [bacterium]MDY3853818.1 ABC transporter ATP-binding protein [Butyribacter sp.]